MTRRTKGTLIKYAALGLDVGAPFIATATQFPVMVERSAGSTMSGLFVMFALLSAIPLIKQFGEKMRTPSIPLAWCICLAAFLALRSIIDEMVIVAAAGAVSNFIGGAMYKYGQHLTDEKEE